MSVSPLCWERTTIQIISCQWWSYGVPFLPSAVLEECKPTVRRNIWPLTEPDRLTSLASIKKNGRLVDSHRILLSWFINTWASLCPKQKRTRVLVFIPWDKDQPGAIKEGYLLFQDFLSEISTRSKFPSRKVFRLGNPGLVSFSAFDLLHGLRLTAWLAIWWNMTDWSTWVHKVVG